MSFRITNPDGSEQTGELITDSSNLPPDEVFYGVKVMVPDDVADDPRVQRTAQFAEQVITSVLSEQSRSADPSEASTNGTANGHDYGSYWRKRAEELATWTERRAVNRRDVSGGYYLDGGKVNPVTSHEELTHDRIVRHYQAVAIGDVLGLHTTACVELEPGITPSLSLWLAIDIDQHGDVDYSAVNLAAAMAWHDALAAIGFRPLLTDSNGKGGFHLRVFFDDPVITGHVHQLGKWLIRDWKALGLEQAPEIFPKQPKIALEGNGSCGNWLRLPGRNPKRDHWSRVWDGSEWLAGDDAIDFILDLTGDSAALIPAEAIPRRVRAPRATGSTAHNANIAAAALQFLGVGAKDKDGREFLTEYSPWLCVGFALHELGDPGLKLWDEWSQLNPAKYRPGDCDEKWGTMAAAGETGITLEYLFHHAERLGWKDRPKPGGAVNEALDDPHRLARLHLAKHDHEGASTLRHYRGEWFGWAGGAYRPVPDPELQAGLNGAIKDEFDRINRIAVKTWEDSGGKDENGKPVDKPQVRKVTRSLTGNASLAMQSMGVLPGKAEAPFWIGDQGRFNASEVLPIRNALVNLPGVVIGDLADPTQYVAAPTPLFFSTYALDFDFDPDAPPPDEFLKFLSSVWPDDQGSIDTLQEWFGYCLTPDTRQQKIGMFIGPKRSGRGTIARLLRALVGPENVEGPRLLAFATNFGLEPLVGKPLAIIGDARLSGRSDTGAIVEAFLSISGEDTLTIDRKHKAPWTGKLPTRLMLLSNELPRLPDQSGALASRFVVWRFTQSFVGREDLGLDARLSAELPSILLWAIEGWKRLRTRGHFEQPKSGVDLIEQVRDIASPVGAFVRECCTEGVGHQVDVATLFEKWCQWCEAKRRQFGDEATFGRNLRTVVPLLETKQRRGDKKKGEKPVIRVFEGVALKKDDYEASI